MHQLFQVRYDGIDCGHKILTANASEMLQNLFVSAVLQESEQALYAEEGIEWEAIEVPHAGTIIIVIVCQVWFCLCWRILPLEFCGSLTTSAS